MIHHLNQTCPKDNFPLLRIDQLVDTMVRHKLLSCKDVYSGYNQIKIYPLNEDKTMLITDREIYCYKVIPFGSKNTGATFQRMISKVFKEEIEHTIEAYIDDVFVKIL